MEKQLKFKEALHSNGLGHILVTLADGRCATVHIARGTVTIEVLLDSFYKWGGFDLPVTPEEARLAEKQINSAGPDNIRCGPKAAEYLTDPDVKTFFDDLKKQANYNY